MSDAPDHFVLICATCNGTQPVEAMRDMLPKGIAIRTVDCMAGCDHPTTVGFQAIGKAQYLFGNIQTSDEIAALVEFAHQYQNSWDGWTNASDRPGPLYTKTLSRLPRIHQVGPV